MKLSARSLVLLLVIVAKEWTLAAGAAGEISVSSPSVVVTNVAQFKTLSSSDYLAGCGFQLTGVVTLLDAKRQLLVLQDSTGAVGLNHPFDARDFVVGDLISLAASNCCPAFARFPDFPHRPSRWDIAEAFEAPRNPGDYQLTRMRGFVIPPVSGDYTFWIASDNSSELWLSPDADPSLAKKIAYLARFEWVAPREWTKYPSQRSEPVWLNANQSYYIEAIHEQAVGDANLAVAWQGPALSRTVISAAQLRPWTKGHPIAPVQTNGILREFWTNFFSGNLAGLIGARPFESALSVEQMAVRKKSKGEMPTPRRISLDPRWLAENNYRWVVAEGEITFVGEDGECAFLKVAEGNAEMQLRAPVRNPALAQLVRHTRVRVAGVCEGVFHESGSLLPGLIWLSSTNDISILKMPNASASRSRAEISRPTDTARAATVMKGYYGTRGVVTFNDRVFDRDWLFVQEGNSAVFVSLKDREARKQLRVGESVDLGGELQRGEFLPILTPMIVTELGWNTMPEPITEPIHSPVPGNRDGRWTEIEGIVHSVNSNGTLSLMSSREAVCVWLGETDLSELTQYIDSKLRVRGVLSLTALAKPVLLTPSRSFVEVVAAAPASAFGTAVRQIAALKREAADSASLHRQRIVGTVTLHQNDSFLVQDESGNIRVQPSGSSDVQIGETVDVTGFLLSTDNPPVLAEALVRRTGDTRPVACLKLDLSASSPDLQSGSLVTVEADLLAQRTVGNSQILELHESQRVFTATLSTDEAVIPAIASGSRLRITGVCNSENAVAPAGVPAQERVSLASINLWMRSPTDVQILSGPPWWTWKRAAILIGALLAILTGTLSWVHLLRRRLQRQKAAQLAFSQQILERLEEERRRIAANLHDSLGQVLLAIKNQTLLAMQRAPDEAAVRQRLGEISGATSQALDEVRQITHGLRPYQLDRLGLTQALHATVSGASTTSSILFASRVEDIDALFDTDSEIHVYRIVQEAINNVLKHSAATEAAVVIKNRANSVSLSIRDNGRGFDAATKCSSRAHDLGYGLSGIAERVRILGGNLTIDSRPDEGTSLSVEIPVHNPCVSKRAF